MLRAPAVVLLVLAPALAQGVLRVGPNRQFTDLQAAIDFARPGDRILVDPGTYGLSSYPYSFTINKGVRITGQPGVVLGSVQVSGLPAGETVTLAGLEIRAVTIGLGPVPSCIGVVDCAGTVAVDSCRLTGFPGGFGNLDYWTMPRLYTIRSALVMASQCVLDSSFVTPAASFDSTVGMLTDCGTLSSQTGWVARWGSTMWLMGGPGLDCTRGGLAQLARTNLQGGPGLSVFYATQPGPGAPGARIEGSEVHLAGPAAVTGGTGGNSYNTQGGSGGPGVHQNGTLFHDTGVSLVGGAGGQGTPPGVPGAPLTGTPATVVSLPSLATTTLQLPGGSFQLDGFAAPGNFLYLLVAFETNPMDVPGLRGRLAPRLDALLFVEGPIVVGGSGRVTRTFAIPPDPSLSGVVLFAQAAGIDPAAFPLVFLSAAVPMTVAF